MIFWISRALSLRHTILVSALHQDCRETRRTQERSIHTAAQFRGVCKHALRSEGGTAVKVRSASALAAHLLLPRPQ